MQDLLVAGLEFLDLRILKIGAKDPLLGLDNLVLEEGRPSNWASQLYPDYPDRFASFFAT